MSKLIFKPEHFDKYEFAFISPKFAAQIAQDIYDAHVASLPVVYGNPDAHGWTFKDAQPSTLQTHTARLLGIQPIEKKECEHVPREEMLIHIDGVVYVPECRHCGVSLIANKWEPICGD